MVQMKLAAPTSLKSVRQVFEKNPDIVAIDDSLRATAPQNRLLIDQNKAMTLGVTPQAIAETLNLGLSGVDTTMLMAKGQNTAYRFV
jgi:multidrug efflux pump subunit AcrB